MTKVLITGGAGFIGSSLANRLLQLEKYEIILADNLLTGNLKKIPIDSRCTFLQSDVNVYDDIASIFDRYRFDYVFHYAAVVGVKRTLDNPLMVLNDIEGIKNVLNLCKKTGVRRVFFSSSSEIYGEPMKLPQHEEKTPLNSKLPYAIVKNVGESFCKSYQKQFGLNYTIFRFFNTYGSKQSIDFVVPKFLKAALQNKPITIYGDGLQYRTFCYIADNINCTVKILENDLEINNVINIGSETSCTILELAKTIIRLTNSSSCIEFHPPLKEGDMSRRQPDASKMIKILNTELITLEAGINRILQAGMSFLK